jgi:hypothetical protein
VGEGVQASCLYSISWRREWDSNLLKRSFNNIERTAGTVKQWKAVVSSANGSQTDHGSVIT